jgi:hypothetical protein
MVPLILDKRIRTTISAMTNLQTYEMRLHSFSDKIIDVIETNNIKLENIRLWNAETNIEKQL